MSHFHERIDEDDHTTVMCNVIKMKNSEDEVMSGMEDDFYYDLFDFEDESKDIKSVQVKTLNCDSKVLNKALHDEIVAEGEQKDGRWIVLEKFREKVLKEFHSESYRGHPGQDKMYSSIKKWYFWKNIILQSLKLHETSSCSNHGVPKITSSFISNTPKHLLVL